MRVLTIVGNRPQFIKSAPLSLALRGAGIDEVVLHTGQHWDADMSQIFFDELSLPEPAYRLDLRTPDAKAMTIPIRDVVERERPDWVIVMGDTNTTLAGAHAAGEEVPVAHVEAGLRSFDLTMPDERSARQLESEGVPGRCEVVGDVMADATRIFAPIARRRDLSFVPPYDVLTIHREANTAPARLRSLLEAVNGLDRHVVFPVHPRTRRVIEEGKIGLSRSIEMVEPLGYLEMLALVSGASVVLTDSGGLQKEAYWLRVPCVTLRASTEWVDTVEAGANTLVDPAEAWTLGRAVAAARFPEAAPPLYGDGHAAERVATALYA
jgi:UDP-GlcNAc3NAcA epimerase